MRSSLIQPPLDKPPPDNKSKWTDAVSKNQINKHSTRSELRTPSDRLNVENKDWEPPIKEAIVTDGFENKILASDVGQLQPGRLMIRCIGAKNIRRKDQIKSKTSMDVFLKFIFEDQLRHKQIQKKTSICKNTGESPSFNNEVVFFDFQEPSNFFDGEDIKLKVQLFFRDGSKDTLLGEVLISAMRLLQPTSDYCEWLPLKEPKDASSNSKVNLKFTFNCVKQGAVLIKIDEYRALKTMGEAISTQMFACFKIENSGKKRSKTIRDKNGCVNFGNEELVIYVDSTYWFNDLQIEVFQVSTDGKKLVGETSTDILQIMNNHSGVSGMKKMKLELHSTSNGVKQTPGVISFALSFLEAGKLSVSIISAKYLRDIATSGRLNPYVTLISNGPSSTLSRKTQSHIEGGVNPLWNEEVEFMVVDHSNMIIECRDDDILTGYKEMIGSGELSLLPVYQKGQTDTWVQLQVKNKVSSLYRISMRIFLNCLIF